MGLFDYFKKKRHKSIRNRIQSDNLPHHQSSGIYNSDADPETYTVIYEFGHVSRISPDPGGSYRDKARMILDARYIISGGVHYDLNNIKSVKSIAIPKYHLYTENQCDKEVGIISSLEYLLNIKYHHFSVGDNDDLALACLAKSTELMIYSDVKWQLESFYDVVDAFRRYKRFQQADKWKSWLDKNVKPIKLEEKKHQPLTYSDKERILVERMTAEDMQQFTNMPYDLNCPLRKFNEPKTHAFAYMDLTEHNIAVAQAELQKLNVVIDYARKEIPSIPKWARINISKIAFYRYSEGFGYTRLMCTPYTFSGQIEQFPLTLHFLSFHPKDSIGIDIVGEINYSVDGRIAHASLNCWKRSSWEKAADGWQYIFYDNNGDLSMREILSTDIPDKYGGPTPIYKCPELLEEERRRERDNRNFQWLQKNLPALCPKSLSGFRRMRTMNSKNYQKLVAEAAKLGKKL